MAKTVSWILGAHAYYNENEKNITIMNIVLRMIEVHYFERGGLVDDDDDDDKTRVRLSQGPGGICP